MSTGIRITLPWVSEVSASSATLDSVPLSFSVANAIVGVGGTVACHPGEDGSAVAGISRPSLLFNTTCAPA